MEEKASLSVMITRFSFHQDLIVAIVFSLPYSLMYSENLIYSNVALLRSGISQFSDGTVSSFAFFFSLLREK